MRSKQSVKIQLASTPAAVKVCTVASSQKQNDSDYRLLQIKIQNQKQVIQRLETQLQNTIQKQQRLTAAIKNTIDQLKQYQLEIVSQAEVQLVDLACDIAERIICREINLENYDIKKIVSEAMKHLPVQQNVIVHVNPDDYAAIVEGTDENSSVSFFSDPNIKPAQCVLETPEGFVTNKIQTTLTDVADALKSF